MNARKALRIAIAAEWALVAAGLTLAIALERFLPAPLQDFLKAESERDLQTPEILVLIGLGVFFVAFLVSSIGLFALKGWARWLYLGAEVLGCVMMMFAGPSVGHAVSSAFESAATAVSGLILGIAFFTDALVPRLSAPPGVNVPVPE